MNCNRKNGRILISCSDNHGPLQGCHITLIDDSGKGLYCAKTDGCGRAELPIFEDGEYQLRAQADSCHSPGAQNRWYRLSPGKTYQCGFLFNQLICSSYRKGTLIITLRDKNYPALTLSDGEFTIWQ